MLFIDLTSKIGVERTISGLKMASASMVQSNHFPVNASRMTETCAVFIKNITKNIEIEEIYKKTHSRSYKYVLSLGIVFLVIGIVLLVLGKEATSFMIPGTMMVTGGFLMMINSIRMLIKLHTLDSILLKRIQQKKNFEDLESSLKNPTFLSYAQAQSEQSTSTSELLASFDTWVKWHDSFKIHKKV